MRTDGDFYRCSMRVADAKRKLADVKLCWFRSMSPLAVQMFANSLGLFFAWVISAGWWSDLRVLLPYVSQWLVGCVGSW